MIITDDDLLNNKYIYSITDLGKNIYNLNKKIILATQKLDAEFCIKYILDMDINNGSEDSYIYDIDYILEFQSHLSYEDFVKLLNYK
jgi:hypothetical protein